MNLAPYIGEPQIDLHRMELQMTQSVTLFYQRRRMLFQLMSEMTWGDEIQRDRYLEEVDRYDDLLSTYREDTQRYREGRYEPSGWMAWHRRQRTGIHLRVVIGIRSFPFDRVD